MKERGVVTWFFDQESDFWLRHHEDKSWQHFPIDVGRLSGQVVDFCRRCRKGRSNERVDKLGIAAEDNHVSKVRAL